MTKPSLEAKHKERARALLNRIGEYNCDYADLLVQLEELRFKCIEGFISEKVSNVADGGKVSVLESFPGVAVQAVNGKLLVLKELSRLADQYDVEPELVINIQLGSLEDSLGIKPDGQ